MLLALSKAVDAKDHYTNGHSQRVAEYAREIARRMGKNEKQQAEIARQEEMIRRFRQHGTEHLQPVAYNGVTIFACYRDHAPCAEGIAVHNKSLYYLGHYLAFAAVQHGLLFRGKDQNTTTFLYLYYILITAVILAYVYCTVNFRYTAGRPIIYKRVKN